MERAPAKPSVNNDLTDDDADTDPPAAGRVPAQRVPDEDAAPDAPPAADDDVPAPAAPDDVPAPAADGPPAPAADGAPAAGRALTRREVDILAFERLWWRHAGAKEQAIRDTFDLSATRYYQLLNTLLDEPAALAHDPMLVKRLRRLRASRTRLRTRPA
jgi:hypothetical protein